MRLVSLLRLLWRRIRRARKVYNLVGNSGVQPVRDRDLVHPTASTYLSFDRPNPPSFLEGCFRRRNSTMDRCHLYTSSVSAADTEYWEIDDTIADIKNDGIFTEGHGTTVILQRFNATSNLQYVHSNNTKNDSIMIRLIKVLKTIKTPSKGQARASLFMPVCSSTPLCVSPESLGPSSKNVSETAGFYRTLDRHVSIPKFPPPPPPVEESQADTFVAFDDDELALWEVEKPRMCLDSMCTVLPISDDSIVLNEDGVDLNETFIDEVTFYVDRPSSAISDTLSVLRVYSKTDPSKFHEIYLSKSVEV